MEKLLIIEDDRDIRETLYELLSLAGYDVEAVKNGKEGYETMARQLPDLVLCDVNMPEMNGFKLLELVNERFRDQVLPPFLFLTAKVEKQDIRRGMNLGADDYILKPFDHSELLKIVRLRLDRRKKIEQKNEPASVLVKKIALPFEDGFEMINFQEIIKCQAERAYCTFYLASGRTILVSKPMKEFEERLLIHDFFKVHKSSIVNMSHVIKFVRGKNSYLVMSDDSMVTVSASKKEGLLHRLRPMAKKI